MELPSTGNATPGESPRFMAAVIAAAVCHALLFAAWSFLPFAHAEPMTDTPPEAKSLPMEVQFVSPPPEPEPVPAPPEPEVEPEPPAPEPVPVPVPENVLSALEKTVPEPAPVIEEPPLPEPVVKKTIPPPPPRPRPTPKPVVKPKPKPAPKKPSATLYRTPAAAPAPAAPPPTAPSYRSNPKPAYPAEAKRLRIEGTTFLKVEVLATGNVGHVTVLKSSGNRLLDQSASSTVQNRWRFRPATRAGTPVSTFVTVPIRFTLR